MTAASGEKVLVWQTITGNRCSAATGGRFDAGESGNRGSRGPVFQRGGVSERE